MEIRNFGTALTKLMSESRNIKTIKDAEKKVLYYLWNTEPLPSHAIYAMRHVPTIGDYVLSHRIGNGTFTDVLLPKTLDSVKKAETGSIARVPEEFPPIPPFKDHRFYTLFPVFTDDYPLYIIMFESPRPMDKLYANFVEEYLSQAKRLLERTTYSYVINMSKKAYETVSLNVFRQPSNTNKVMHQLAEIFISKHIPLTIIMTGNEEKLIGVMKIKGKGIEFSIDPNETLLKGIKKYSQRKITLLRKWDIPSYILNGFSSITPPDKLPYLENLSYGIVGVEMLENNFYIVGIFTNDETVPFTETDAQTLKNVLPTFMSTVKLKHLREDASHQINFIESAISTFKVMLDQSRKKHISVWNSLRNITKHFVEIKGIYAIENKHIIPLKEVENINIEEIAYRLQNAYTLQIDRRLWASKMIEGNTEIIIIHSENVSPVEKQAVKAIFRNLAVARDYVEQTGKHLETIKRLTMILPTAMEEIGIEPKGQTQKMLNLAWPMAEKLGIDNVSLRIAIVFHDVGKLYLPLEILTKNGPLTDEEFEVAKTHVIHSRQFVSDMETLSTEVETAILHHHENYDGSGYPHGLKGEEIPLLARILRVLDTYTAMTSDRIYKQAVSQEEAIKHLRNYSGVYYDPEVVNALIEVLNS